ncbi:putative damage-inducible protein DinB [Nocardia transvalensis]|uniref:Putative damage-inducible protein DinB n=1 Tax=Nocardia transvalensis TaxID=37333 RepID=A0A7W9UHI0_9NOCA|nr:DinB family protein [Nocardia transvalensis]MBB5913384.1 putative damage-inducible protein DinB [Nocardia transvalensis]
MTASIDQAVQERETLIEMLASQRDLFRITLRDIDDDQARQRSTVSELTLGGLLHHLVHVEQHWTTVIVERDEDAEIDVSQFDSEYKLAPEETVEGLLKEWDAVADNTADLIRTVDSLDTSIPTPTAPWAPERVWWTVRFTILHILREISHHSGHADILREALDGANTTHQRAN